MQLATFADWLSKSCHQKCWHCEMMTENDGNHNAWSHDTCFRVALAGFLANGSKPLSMVTFLEGGSESSKARLVPINNTLSEKEVSYWLSIMRAAKAGLASSEERETAVDCQVRLLFTQATTSISRNAHSSTATGITIIFTSAGSSSENGGL